MNPNVSFRTKSLFVIRPYAQSDGIAVRHLLGRLDNFYAPEAAHLYPYLDAAAGPWEGLVSTVVQVASISSSSRLSGVAIAQCQKDMPDRWMLECILVEPEFRRQGQGRTLLSCLERELKRLGGRHLGVELPHWEGGPRHQAFLERNGFVSYDGIGLSQRHFLSQFYRKELGDSPAALQGGIACAHTSPRVRR